jgi:hypothetical protein
VVVVAELEPWLWLVRRKDRKRTLVVVECPTRFEALILGARQMGCVVETAHGADPVLGLVDARAMTDEEIAKRASKAAA